MAERDDAVLSWLLEGDPAIRWQVMRDLLDEPAETGSESGAHASRPAGSQSCSRTRGADGEWPKGRWTASTWTLLLLVASGCPKITRPPARRSSVCSIDSCRPGRTSTVRTC